MNYLELKETTLSLEKEFQKGGKTLDEAEAEVLQAAVYMLNKQQLGIIDVKFMFQILGYDFSGELAEDMAEAKRQFRAKYGLDKRVKELKKKGFSEDLAAKATIRSCYDAFLDGAIEGPELLDGLLWSLGYRLEEKFFLDFYAGKTPELSYELDE